MADGPNKNISNYPGARWHASNVAKETGAQLARARRGVTYINLLKSPVGEIVERANGKTGEAKDGLFILISVREDENSFNDPPPKYFQAIRLRTESGLEPDTASRDEFAETDAIRRHGRLTGKAFDAMINHPEVARLRRFQDWGMSEEEIQRIITTPKLEPKPPSALELLKDAVTAMFKGRISN